MRWFVVSLISVLMLGLHGGPAAAEKFRITTAETDQIRMLVPLIKEVYRRIGHEAEVTFLPSLRSLASSNSGKFDAELARTTTAVVEYPNLVQVPEPSFVVSASVIVQKGSDISEATWKTVGKHSIVYPRGYVLLDARTRGMNATVVGKPDNIARMVMKDRVEIGILLTYDAEKFASEMSSLRVIEPPIETVALYHYVHFKHRSLVPLLKEVLIKMHKTGEVREILQRAQ
jgi:polar amino acid transport system substrate-binding protein